MSKIELMHLYKIYRESLIQDIEIFLECFPVPLSEKEYNIKIKLRKLVDDLNDL